MQSGKVSIIGFLTGFLLLAVAGVLVLTTDSSAAAANLRGRRLQTNTGLSGTPSSDSGSGSSTSFDNSLFGGNHNFTLAPMGVVGGEYIVYMVCGLLVVVYAWFYKLNVVDAISPLPKQPDTGKDDFDVGILACMGEFCMCVQLILPCMVFVRQAHTNEVTKLKVGDCTCGFWATFWAYYLSGVFCGIGPCCLTVFFRMRLKDHMGIEDHLINDLCCAWLCLPCAVGQQALAVDRKLGYEVECCCDLKFNDPDENSRFFQKPPQDPNEQGYDYEARDDDYAN